MDRDEGLLAHAGRGKARLGCVGRGGALAREIGVEVGQSLQQRSAFFQAIRRISAMREEKSIWPLIARRKRGRDSMIFSEQVS